MSDEQLKKKRVLIVAPSFPYPESGAEQMDRASGVRLLVACGFEVLMIAKSTEWADKEGIDMIAKKWEIAYRLVPYKYSNRGLSFFEKIKKHLGKLANPRYLDGAAYEYSEPEIRRALSEELDRFKPDIVWFEYTYLWPLYDLVKKKGIPIVTRSVNYEPRHFLEEDGFTLLNYIKYIPKFWGEKKVAKESDVIAALNPNEAELYKSLGAKNVHILPLRFLPDKIQSEHPIREGSPLHVLFMGSSYNVDHNLKALELVITEVVPKLKAEFPGQFVFHITGTRVPESLDAYFDGSSVINEGYVSIDKLGSFLKTIDIAVSPSPKRVGMQGKVFEPLVRGIPVVTSRGNMVGYPFEDGVSVIFADTCDEIVAGLLRLRDSKFRTKLSSNAISLSNKLFSGKYLKEIISQIC